MKFTWRVLGKLALLQLLSALFSCAFVYMQMQLISDLEMEKISGRLAVVTVITLICMIILELFESYRRGREYAVFSVRVKERAAQAFLGQPAWKYGDNSNEEHLSFFSNDVNTVLNQYFYMILYGMKMLIQFSTTFLTLFVISWQCGLAVIMAAVGFGVVIRFFSESLSIKQQKVQEKKADFVDTLVELHEGYEELHLNQMEQLAEEHFTETNKALEQTQYHFRLAKLRMEILGIGQNMLIYILILIIGGILTYRGKTGIGVFVSAAGLSVQALNQWSLLSRIWVCIKGVEPLKKELDVFLEATTPEKLLSLNKENMLLEVRNLSFYYEEGTPLLEDVNLVIHKGKKYLITGRSGKGKSTLLELLAGHKIGQSGELFKYTDKIAYIPQEPYLFSGTLRQNLVFDQNVPDTMLDEMLKKLNLDLPLDLVIELGGANLSGGQRMRIALARALLSTPDLLIIDELTANLDQVSGQMIEEMLIKEYPYMALCAVAHRTYCWEGYDVKLELGINGLQEISV